MTLLPDSPEACLAEVRRLYRSLQALPGGAESARRTSPDYVAIQQQIKQYADRFVALVEAEVRQVGA